MTSTTPVAAMAASTAAQNNAAASALSSNSTPTESMFLQLLVAQLKNQDPTTPQDPTAFVSELAQFSALEQDVTIATNTTTMAQDMTKAASSASTTGTTGTTPSSNSNTPTGQTDGN